MGILCAFFTLLCVRSFIAARRGRLATDGAPLSTD
jgi:hypothetical protein